MQRADIFLIKNFSQMYKIYINETPLNLVRETDVIKGTNNEQNLVARYPGNPRHLFGYIDMLEKTQRFESVTLYSADYDKLVKDFEGLYKILEAAGGVVYQPSGEILAIFRRDFWDLPKGKIDPGESQEEAAVREVQEETGIQDVVLGDFITTTHHTYRTKSKKRIIKRTFWYKMTTSDTDLVPQTEEDIEQAVWITKEDLLKKEEPIYNNILEVLSLCE